MRFDCSERRCPSDCSGGYTPLAGGPTNRSALGARGLCVDGHCECAHGYGGAGCSERIDFAPTHCLHDCGGRGATSFITAY